MPSQDLAPRAVVVVPTYNEAENLNALAEAVFSACPNADMLCVDDASPDGTGVIADALAAQDERFHVLHRESARGYAPSSRDGFRWCLERDFDVVVTMDGDLSHDPALIPAIIERSRAGADLVIGSRYIDGGGLVVDWGPTRRAVSELGSAYARAMIGAPVRDCTSGYRCYKCSILEQVDFGGMRSEGYAFLIEMLAQMAAVDALIEEFPITYTDRRHGQSKISRSIILEALVETTRLGARRLLPRSGRPAARESK